MKRQLDAQGWLVRDGARLCTRRVIWADGRREQVVAVRRGGVLAAGRRGGVSAVRSVVRRACVEPARLSGPVRGGNGVGAVVGVQPSPTVTAGSMLPPFGTRRGAMSATTPTAGERDAYLLYTHVLGIEALVEEGGDGHGLCGIINSLDAHRPGAFETVVFSDDVALELHHGAAN